MTNINLSQVSYVDYVASLYLNACKVQDVKFTKKVVPVGDEQVPLIHVEGTQMTTGIIVNFDLWPRNEATEEDLKAMPESLDDIHFRVGYWPEVDANTGETRLREGKPKWIAYIKGGKKVVLDGEKREYQG